MRPCSPPPSWGASTPSFARRCAATARSRPRTRWPTRTREAESTDRRRRLAELLRRHLVGDDLPVEGLGVDLQERGGLAAMTADLLEGAHDVSPLHHFQASRRRRWGA